MKPTTQVLAVVFGCLLVGCHRDSGRKLVNAVGSTNEVLTVLSNGADINQPSKTVFGWTPLISAIYHGKDDVVELLIARGADVNRGDGEGRTPIMWAIQRWPENTNLIRKLIKQKADPTIKNLSGMDAFQAARSQPNAAQLIEILRSH